MDLALSTSHRIRSGGGVGTYRSVSRKHPSFLLTPGTIKEDVAGEIAKLTRLSPTLRSMSHGSLAVIAAVDIKIPHALLESETTSRWYQKMSSFIVGEEKNSSSEKGKIWAISSQEKTSSPDAKPMGELLIQSPEIEELFRRIKGEKSGYLPAPADLKCETNIDSV